MRAVQVEPPRFDLLRGTVAFEIQPSDSDAASCSRSGAPTRPLRKLLTARMPLGSPHHCVERLERRGPFDPSYFYKNFGVPARSRAAGSYSSGRSAIGPGQNQARIFTRTFDHACSSQLRIRLQSRWNHQVVSERNFSSSTERSRTGGRRVTVVVILEVRSDQSSSLGQKRVFRKSQVIPAVKSQRAVRPP